MTKSEAIISVCNMALHNIAAKKIVTLTENTPEAIACNDMYDYALKEALRGHDWGFATTVLELQDINNVDDWVTNHAYIIGNYVVNNGTTYYCLVAHTSGTFATDLGATIPKWEAQSTYTPLDWDYAYSYPVNFVAFWHIYNEGETHKEQGQAFRELLDPVNQKKVIVSNVPSPAYGEGTYLVDDPRLWDSNFMTAFGYRLASAIVIPLTANAEQAKTMIDGFNKAINDAERMSSYENNPKEIEPNEIAESRM